MKNKLLVILLSICAATATIGLTACGGGGGGSSDGEPGSCEHEYLNTIQEARAATCEEDGYLKVTECSSCGTIFIEELGAKYKDYNQAMADARIIGGHDIVAVPEQEPADCQSTGVSAHFKCNNCEKLFSDPEGYNEKTLSELVVPAGHDTYYVPYDSASCTETGNESHYKCFNCDKLFAFSDGTEELTEEDIIIEKKDHTINYSQEEKAATCLNQGNVAFWYCYSCDTYYGDEDCTTVLDEDEIWSSQLDHAYDDVDVVRAAGCDYNKIIKYTCVNGCEEGDWGHSYEEEVEDTMLGHNFVGGVCQNCQCDEFTQGLSIEKYGWGEDVYATVYGFGSWDATGVLTIPESYQGYPVKEVSISYADFTNVTKIVIPETVNDIYLNNDSNSGSKVTEIVIKSSELNDISILNFNKLTSVNFTDEDYVIHKLGKFSGLESIETLTLNGDYTEIKEQAFYNNYKLKNLTLSDKVTDIKYWAFRNCYELESVPYFNELQTIAYEVFENCYELKEIYLPSTVTSIAMDAFLGCTSLEKVIIDDVKDFAKIGFNISNSSSSNAFSVNPLSYAHWLYKKTASGVEPYGDIVLDNTIYGEDYESTKIGAWAFTGCYNVTKLVVPTGITTIGEQAFLNCKRLTEIEFHDKTRRNDHTLTTLGKSAFEGCTSLESVYLANTLTNVGSDAFKGCESVTAVYFNKLNVTTPDWLAITFNNLYSNPMWAGNAKFYAGTYNGTITYQYGEVASIDLDPLSGYDTYETRESVTVPAYAFAGMNALIKGLEYVSSIGNGAFYNAGGVNGYIYLNEYTRNENLKGRNPNFKGCTSIGEEAFYGCYNLKGVYLPSSASSTIGNRAFAYTGLQSFTTNNSSMSFGQNILEGCNEVSSFGAPYLAANSSTSSNTGLDYFFGTAIPASLKYLTLHGTIRSGDIVGANNITSVHVDSSTTISNGAFGSDNNQIGGFNLYFNGTIEQFIRASVIGGEYALKNVKLYAEFETGEVIVNGVVKKTYETRLVKDLIIPDSVSSIGSYKFAGITSIETVTINKYVSIYSKAFYGCTNLLELVNRTMYPDYNGGSVLTTTAGESSNGYVAYYAKAIYTIPLFDEDGNLIALDRDVLRTHDGYVFALSGTVPSTATLVKYTGQGGDITLPAVFIDNDANHDGYIDENEKDPNGAAKYQNYDIVGSVFANNLTITSVTFPVNELGKSTVKSIGNNAFDGCSNLKTVELKEGLESIGQYAFRSTALQTVVIPDSVTTLGTSNYSPFSGCGDLYQITVGKNSSYVNYLVGGTDNLKLAEIIDRNGSYISYKKNYNNTWLENIAVHNGESKIFYQNDFAFIRNDGKLTIVAYVGNETEITLPDLGEAYEIGIGFLRGNKTVTKVVISDDATAIGKQAFYQSAVQEVIIGDGVTLIDKQAFELASDLTVLEMGESVATINSYAFDNVGLIEEVIFPASLKVIEDQAFRNAGIKKIVLASGFAPSYISGFSLPELEELHVSSLSTILGLDMVQSFFYSNYEEARLYVNGEMVTELTITGDDCDVINDHTFSSLQGIDKITIDGVSKIGYYAFYDVSATEVIIKNVEEVDEYAFFKYSSSDISIETLVLENVKVIGGKSFYNNKKLSSLTMSGVEEIGDSAFRSSVVKEVTLPSTLKVLGSYAFSSEYGYTSVKNLVLPESLEELGAGYGDAETTEYNGGYYLGSASNPYFALVGVEYSIDTITLHSDTKIAAGYSLSNTDDYISEVVLNEGLISIGYYVFGGAGKGSLTSLTLPSTLKYISSYAFNGLSLDSIAIPANVERIGEYAFNYCTDLSSVTFASNSKVEVIKNHTFYYCDSLQTVVLPDSVKVIEEYAFTNVVNLTLGSNVEYIEKSAFNDYSGSLSAIYVESIEDWLNIEFGDAFHSDATLYVGGEILTEVIIPETVTVINAKAFYDNDNITSFVGSSSLETIEAYAFYNCDSLASVDFGGAKYIGDNAFYSCYALTEIDASNVVSIGAGAFLDSAAKTELTLGASLMEIGESAFGQYSANMANGANVYFEGTADDWAKINFANMYSSPLGCSSSVAINFYLNGEQPTEITLSTETIADYAFYRVPYIVSVTLEDTVKTIGKSAFAECSALTTVTMNGVETIGESAFSEDSQITSITGFDTVKNIGLQAFYYVSIDNLDLSSIETIAEQAFYYATIGSMSVGSNLVSIGRDAFSHASGNYSLDFEFAFEELASKSFGSEYANPAYYASSVTFNGAAAPETATLTMAEIKPYAYAGVQFINLVLADGVETVGDGAFYKNNKLVSVEMSDSVTTLGSSAFYNCTNLTNVTFSNSLTEIKSYTFVNTKIVDVVLSDSIKLLNYKAFTYSGYDVTPLIKSIHFGKDFKEFGESSYGGSSFFSDNYKVTEVTLDEENVNFVIEDGILYNANKTVLIYCFDKTKTIVEVPEGVTIIKEKAFREMKSLTILTLPSTLTEIEDEAFRDCDKLVEIINKSNLTIRANQKDSNNGYVGYYSMSVVKSADEATYSVDEEGFVTITANNSKILIGYVGEETNITLPSDIQRVYKYAFYGLELDSLVIENTNITYDNNAFTGLKVINLTIPAGALSSLDLSVEELTISGGSISNSLGSYNKLKSSVKTLTICEDASFYENNTNNPFQYFKALQTLNVYCSYIKINAFSNCTALETINLGENVTRIGSGAFYQCSAIKTVNYSGTINDWASIAFNDGSAYNSAGYTPLYYGADLYINGVLVEGEVTIDVATVKAHAFYNYDRINAVILSDNVITVESSAFADMGHLTHVTVGKNVNTIDNYAFDSEKIVDIYNRSTLAIIAHTNGNNKNFGYLGFNAINVYTASSDKKIAYDNNGFATLNYGDKVVLVDYYGETADIVVPSNVTEILACAFYRFSATYLEDPSVATITIPSSVTYVHKEAFTYAQFASIIFEEKTGWYTVERSKSGYSIWTSAIEGNVEEQVGGSSDRNYFYDIQRLSNENGCLIRQEGNLKYLVKYVGTLNFDENGKFTIVVPEGVTDIGYCAFAYLGNASEEVSISIVMPNSLKRIEKYAFYWHNGHCCIDEIDLQNNNSGWYKSNTGYSNGSYMSGDFGNPVTAATVFAQTRENTYTYYFYRT